MKLTKSVLKIRSIMLSTALFGVLFGAGGCTSMYEGMPAKQAWKSMSQNAEAAKVAGIFLPDVGELGKILREDEQRAERESNEALRSDLPVEAVRRMVNDMASYFSEELPKQPQVVASKTKFVLAFGNPDSLANTDKTRQALTELQAELCSNQAVTANFVFLSSTESDAKSLSDKLAGGDTSVFRDPLQRAADLTKPVVYDPNSIFLIQGSMDKSANGPEHEVTINMTVKCNSLTQRACVSQKTFSKTYVWHPARKEWELQS